VHSKDVGPKLATRGGVNGSRSKFLPKSICRPISQNHRKPSNLGQREYLWTSYLEAKDLGCSAEAKMRETSQISAQHIQTGLTGILDRSDRSGWEIQTADRSDRLHRPVRPVSPRQPANQAPNIKSRANELQIQRNLEESFATTP